MKQPTETDLMRARLELLEAAKLLLENLNGLVVDARIALQDERKKDARR